MDHLEFKMTGMLTGTDSIEVDVHRKTRHSLSVGGAWAEAQNDSCNNAANG
jgi:hypothetical protein